MQYFPLHPVHPTAFFPMCTAFPSPSLNVLGSPGESDGTESASHAGDLGLLSGWGRSPGERNGNPLQYSCLEDSMDGGAWLQSTGMQRVGLD